MVKLAPAPAGKEWMWSMLLTHPGPAFRQPTNGRTLTRGGAGAARMLAPAVGLNGWLRAGSAGLPPRHDSCPLRASAASAHRGRVR